MPPTLEKWKDRLLTYGGKYTIALNPKLAGKTITFTLNGKVIGKGVSDANGVVSIQLSKSILGSAGNKKLVITFNGDDFYNSASTSVTISVSKRSIITKQKLKTSKLFLKTVKINPQAKLKSHLSSEAKMLKKLKANQPKNLKKD